jgi:hypothetical protein
MDHYRYSATDPDDPRFCATAVVEDEELLTDIRTELESGERSALLNGADQLRKILAHFFPRYKSVRTSWWCGENLATFNRGVAAGATPEEAVVRAPMGHQLALAGFSRIVIQSLQGFPARYTKIVVRFLRPVEPLGKRLGKKKALKASKAQ